MLSVSQDPKTLVAPGTSSFSASSPQLWAIMIGISRYPNLLPLPCAERDAQDLHEWLTKQAGLSSERALLLTDFSATFYQHSTYPDRSTLSYWIQQLRTQGVRSGDTVWFFFSGYGDCWDGEDYLLPIDADPTSPPYAWIKTTSLLRALKALPTDRIVVFLDINRHRSNHHGGEIGTPLGKQLGKQLGAQTAHYAQEIGITTVLSCHPDQVAQESPDLRNGLFTAALLDTLRSQTCQQELPAFLHRLTVHLAHICAQSDRPIQTPLITLAETSVTIPTPMLMDCLTTGDLRRYARTPVMTRIAAAPRVTTHEAVRIDPIVKRPVKTTSPMTTRPVATSRPMTTHSDVKSPMTTRPVADRPVADRPIAKRLVIKTLATRVRSAIESALSIELRLVAATGLLAVILLGLLTMLGTRSLQTQLYTNQLTPAKPTPKPSLPLPTITPLQVPEQPAGNSDIILEEARNYITPTNPDEVLRAIDRASQIPPGDPGYATAQRQIDRWSNQLFTLAQAEANQGNWRTAIAIASQIRRDRSALHEKATASIQTWKSRSK